MIVLSPAEMLVANEYCKGLADKEVADNLNKSVWTVKTQKRTIYRNWVSPKIRNCFYI